MSGKVSKIEHWEEQGNKHLNMKGLKRPLPYHKIISDLTIQYSGEGDSVLDIGCGLGQTSALVAEKGDRELHIADAYEVCLEATRARVNAKAEYLIGEEEFDITEKIKDQFKIVIMSHVLEHMLNPVQAVQDALSLVEDGGYLILAVPNPARPGVLLSNITKTHYVNRGHVMTWDMSHWINFLENILKLDVAEYRNDFVQIKGCNSVPAIMSVGEALGRVLPWWCFSNIAVVRK